MTVMKIELAFGKTGITANLPEGFRYRVLEARTATPLPDWQGALESALDRPIGAPPLAELARGKRSAAISVCDITRPAPNRLTLPPVLRRLEQAGIPREQITILIATGLHRAATDAEIREICGEEIAAAYRVVNHDARNLSSHRHLGSTQSGTPVYIDERFAAADLHITLGFIEPHLMLGYSGGRKLIAPGLAAQETIKVLHSPKFMRDVARRGGLDRGQPAASRIARNRAPGAARFHRRCRARPRPVDRRRVRRRRRTGAPRRSRVRFAGAAPDPGGTGGRRDHHLGRIPARPHVLPVHQRRDRGLPHRETGRIDSAGRGLHRRRGRAGVRQNVGRGHVRLASSWTASKALR